MIKHSVYLDKEKCTGCTTCVKVCPTEAIRVFRGKAVIKDDFCIDCGRCIKSCPHHAMVVKADSLDRMADYEYNVALVPSALFGQFRNLTDANIVLEGLLDLGFDDVMDIAAASEMMLDHWHKTDFEFLDGEKPRLTSCCPVTIRLIALRFPDLVDNVVDHISPIELAAMVARNEAMEKTGLPAEKIGICYISPCPGEITRVKQPIGFDEPVIDYVVPLNEMYLQLLNTMKHSDSPRDLLRTGKTGFNWSRSGGICATLDEYDAMAADGIVNVIAILEDIEDGRMTEADIIELDCCTQSCFGSCLCAENPYTAKMRMKKIVLDLDDQRNTMPPELADKIRWTKPLEESNATRFSENIGEALRIQAEADRVLKTLPAFDCGSCGAPSCSAFADDVALGLAEEGDCIYNIIKKMRNREKEDELDEFLPPPFRRPLSE